MYTPDKVLIHAGVNVLNNKNKSNTENVLSNIKYMVDKCHKFGVKNILISHLVNIWFGFHHKSIVRSAAENP